MSESSNKSPKPGTAMSTNPPEAASPEAMSGNPLEATSTNPTIPLSTNPPTPMPTKPSKTSAAKEDASHQQTLTFLEKILMASCAVFSLALCVGLAFQVLRLPIIDSFIVEERPPDPADGIDPIVRPDTLKAHCRLMGNVFHGDTASGIITFEQKREERLKIKAQVNNVLTPTVGDRTKVAILVHYVGNISTCYTVGPHYNPEEGRFKHGGPDDEVRHVGDLGNWDLKDGKIDQEKSDPRASLYGDWSIIGRAMVLHGRSDDFGKTEDIPSKEKGNAGPNSACCVIGILDN